MKLRLIAIDMDDTVYLERDYVRSGFRAVDRHVLEHAGVAGFFTCAWDLFVEGERGDVFDQVLATLSLKNEFDIIDLVRCYREHTPEIRMTEDSMVFLEAVKGRVPLALVTDGPSASQRRKIDALGLEHFVDELIVTDERGATWGKPQLTAFEHLQVRFGAEPESCIYLADNPAKDFQAPGSLGWQSLRIRRAGSLHYEHDSTVEEAATMPNEVWVHDRL